MLVLVIFLSLLLLAAFPTPAYAMHIMEGFLPPEWSLLWFVVVIPFWYLGIKTIKSSIKEHPNRKMLLALATAYIFVLSALKIPSLTGSCSHPTGTGLGAILFGPAAMSVMGGIVLLFQALLLAHGGLSTLGANTFSMGVVGPFIAFGIYRLLGKLPALRSVAVFLAVMLGDLMTYVITSIQLALAFPDPYGGVAASFLKFAGIFAFTQVPLAVSEGILTLIVFNFLINYNKDELQHLQVLPREVVK